MDKDYEKFREKVYNDIKHYEIYIAIYSSYEKNIWEQREKLNITAQRYEWVIYFLGNSLITDMYVTLRRLLSYGQNELSLYQFYQKHLKSQICATNFNEFNELLLQRILPNSHESWKDLKKFIDKRIAHSDKGKDIIPFPIDKTRMIFEDLKKAFDEVTRKVEDATYSFDQDDVSRLSDIVFNRMIHHED